MKHITLAALRGRLELMPYAIEVDHRKNTVVIDRHRDGAPLRRILSDRRQTSVGQRV